MSVPAQTHNRRRRQSHAPNNGLSDLAFHCATRARMEIIAVAPRYGAREPLLRLGTTQRW